MAEENIDISQIIEMTAEDVVEIIKNNQKEAKKYAEQILEKAKIVYNLTQTLDQIQQNYNQINKHIKKLKEAIKLNSNDQTIKNQVEQYEAAKKILRNMGKEEAIEVFKKNIKEAILNLQIEIHSFQQFFGLKQGQTFVIQYVIYNRGQPKVYQIPFEKAISITYEGLSHGFVSRINFSQKKLQDKIQKQQENDILKIEQITKDIENLYEHNKENKQKIDKIYSLAYQRFQKSEDNTIFINLHQGKQIKFIINNKGDLAEGYLRFLYKIQQFSTTDNEEQNLFEFITKGVVPVTNQSGFFLEDIAFNGKQIGSKFGSAQALQFKQIVKLAQQVLNLLDGKISEQSLKDFLNKEPFFHGAQRNGLKDEINNGTKIYAQEEIKNYLKERGINIT